MNAQQLRKWIEARYASRAAFAKDLDLSDRTVRRYLSGKCAIPRVVALAVRGLELGDLV